MEGTLKIVISISLDSALLIKSPTQISGFYLVFLTQSKIGWNTRSTAEGTSLSVVGWCHGH